MPSSLRRPVGFCPTPTCGARSNGPCAACRGASRQATDARRGSRHQRGYGNAWARLSAAWKASHPFCGMRADGQLHADHSQCVQRGLRYPGDPNNPLVTDHVLSREDGGLDDEANFQTLCSRCHGAKTATVDHGFGRKR